MGMASPQGQALDTRFEADEVKSEADLLQHDVDRLLMISEALWNFLKTQHGYTDADLIKAVGAIDLRNAGADKDAQEKCPTCGHMVSAHRRLCLYCGNPVPESLFDRSR
jgi:hypothetical protein